MAFYLNSYRVLKKPIENMRNDGAEKLEREVILKY
jgi:hypothetical protein